MTYNIHHGKGMDKKVDLHRIAKVLKDSKADIIGINEVDRHFSKRSDFIDQLHFLATQLGYYCEFSPSIQSKSKKKDLIHQYGNGILSRYPIKSTNQYSFNLIKGMTETRSLLEAMIEIEDKKLQTFVTHLSLNPILHKTQTNFIINNTDKPAVILGDWNMKPNSKKWGLMSNQYRDVWDEVGNGAGFTYPSTKPRIRLDYIFVTDNITIIDATVLYTEASDHLPLVSTLFI